MPGYLLRLVVAVLTLLLIQWILAASKLREPANNTLWIVSLVVAILFVLFGGYVVDWQLPLKL